MNTVVIVLACGAAVLVSVLWYLAVYNSFVRLRNLVAESWSQVDVVLQRRHDLVPNLVATAERAASIERATLEAVTEARNRASSLHNNLGPGIGAADQISAMANAESALTAALGRLSALAEQYPEVGAVRNYVALQQELADTEDRIAAARRLYNANVRALNTKIESTPAAAVAALHHVSPAEYFVAPDPRTGQAVAVDGLWRDKTD